MQGNPFLKTDVFNLVTFAVAPSNISKNIEDRDKLGRTALEIFISNRMVDKKIQFWSPQKMNNFLYFKDVGATVQTKIKGQLVSIKQERKLLSRLVVAAKSRPEFNVKDCTGNYEFNVAPPSNFHPDGSMIMSSAKHQVVALVNKNVHLGEEVVIAPQEQEQELVGSETSVLIIDAMCVVNMVTKTPDLTQSAHFAEKFVDMIATISTSYDEIRVAFDQYLPGSLKEQTGAKRTS